MKQCPWCEHIFLPEDIKWSATHVWVACLCGWEGHRELIEGDIREYSLALLDAILGC